MMLRELELWKIGESLNTRHNFSNFEKFLILAKIRMISYLQNLSGRNSWKRITYCLHEMFPIYYSSLIQSRISNPRLINSFRFHENFPHRYHFRPREKPLNQYQNLECRDAFENRDIVFIWRKAFCTAEKQRQDILNPPCITLSNILL